MCLHSTETQAFIQAQGRQVDGLSACLNESEAGQPMLGKFDHGGRHPLPAHGRGHGDEIDDQGLILMK